MQSRLERSAYFVVLVLASLTSRCGCSEEITGYQDATDTSSEMEDTNGETDVCGTCDDSDPCTEDSCDPMNGECVHEPIDGDGDGYAPESCGGEDCDDTDDSVYPGAPEVCMDGVDQDCDGIVDGPLARMATVHLKTLSGGGVNPILTWTGSEFVAVWDDMNQRIDMARVDLDGEIVGEVLTLVESGHQMIYPDVSWNGSEIAVSYTDGDSLTAGYTAIRHAMFLRASPDGALIGSPMRLDDVDTYVRSVRHTWTGSEYGVVWNDGRDDACSTWDTCLTDIYFTRVDAEGAEVGSEVRITNETEATVFLPGMPIWTGTEFLMFWGTYDAGGAGASYLSHVSPEGIELGGDVEITVPGTSHVWTGSQIGVVWSEDVGGSDELFKGRFDLSGSLVGEPVQVTDAPHYQGHGNLVWTESEYGVVWIDGRDSGADTGPTTFGDQNRDLYFTILDAGGVKVWDDAKITVRDAWVTMPSLEWTGSEFGLVWFEFVSEAGTSEPAVAFDVISFCD